MKNYKIISLLFLVIFLFGCATTSTIEQAEYTSPVLKYQPRIEYPEKVQGRNFSGVSKVYLHITKEGKVEKVILLESSGYSVLDEAALEYCKKMIFEPAIAEDKPVACKTVQKINFNLLDQAFSYEGYTSAVKYLYRLEESADKSEKVLIQDRILQKHSEFLHLMSNVVNFNSAIQKVMLPSSSSGRSVYMNDWPLTFLLYHDFIQRYPAYEGIEVVKQYLSEALNSDMQFILSIISETDSEQQSKTDLVSKIKKFMEKHYPGIPVVESKLTAGLSS